MSTIHKKGDIYIVATKGGVDEVVSRCSMIYEGEEWRDIESADRNHIAEVNREMAENALRVLAVATRELNVLPPEINSKSIEKDLTFVGLIGMMDPPREEVKSAVVLCREAGIKPVMITGDHKITAISIATQLGIMGKGDRAITGAELDKMSSEDLIRSVENISVYARVSPEHKVRIVEAFQERGKIVAMTGDGVNDAPALKLADIGVAMGITGTDVSKEAADIVLTDDNFATIVTAVEEGRRIYDNILKAIQFLLSTNIGEILVLFIAVVLNWNTPLLPIHILWINLVTESLPALALSVDKASPDIMRRQPADPHEGLMTPRFTTRILLQGMMIGALSLIGYRIGLRINLECAQTMTFAILAFSQISLVFGVHSGNRPALRNLFSNKYLLGAAAIITAMMLAVLEIPALKEIFHVTSLDFNHWLWIISLSLAPLPITDISKSIRNVFSKRKGNK